MARQRVLEASGNLKVVQKLLNHASTQTTAEIYVDSDLDQLAETMAKVRADDAADNDDSESCQSSP
jgi:site-specific recombinase XerC